MKSHRMQKETFERKARERDIENDELKQKQKEIIEQNDKLKETKDQIAKVNFRRRDQGAGAAPEAAGARAECNAGADPSQGQELNAMREQNLKGERNTSICKLGEGRSSTSMSKKKSSACHVKALASCLDLEWLLRLCTVAPSAWRGWEAQVDEGECGGSSLGAFAELGRARILLELRQEQSIL